MLRRIGGWLLRTVLLIICGYLLVLGLYHMNKNFYDEDRAVKVNPIVELNRGKLTINDFEYLADYSRNLTILNKSRFKYYADYHEQIIALYPDKLDALGMAAYCHYQLGDFERALALYKKAIARYPRFFWFYFNRGRIYYERKSYQQAIDQFKVAHKCEANLAIRLIVSSKRIYTPMAAILFNNAAGLSQQLKAGFRDSLIFIVMGSYHTKNVKSILQYARVGISSQFDDTGFFSFWSGYAAFEMKQYPVAQTYFQESIARNPNLRDSFLYLSNIYGLIDNEMKAKEFEQKARQIQDVFDPFTLTDRLEHYIY
ncbi:MAG: tetratricopeptide repeat protein [Candidatus Omnitrophica bacterium]|nr:tetratricopeptide repeat protein [Candidatus Omnitrophota bacterium]